MSESDVALSFLTSPEFQARNPGDAGYVQGLYRSVLGREGSAGEVGFWEQVLQQGARSRAAVAFYFLTSGEAYLAAIDDYFGTFLRRSVDPIGQSTFFRQMVEGTISTAQLTAEILASSEYLSRIVATAASDRPIL
jgi:hypothetical protein